MSERVQHLRFNRTGAVRLTGYGPDPIGFVVEAERTGPRGGKYLVYNWRPNCSCPPHLLGPIHPSTRMRQIHGELLTLHYRPKAKSTSKTPRRVSPDAQSREAPAAPSPSIQGAAGVASGGVK